MKTVQTHEELMPDLVKEWLDDGRILAFTFHRINPAVIAEWEREFRAEMQNFLPSSPALYLHDTTDLTLAAVSATAYSVVVKMLGIFQRRAGRTAIVNRSAPTVKFFNSLLQGRRQNGPRQRKIFATRAEALEWLREAL